MKLSQAIRIGAKQRPESYGIWWRRSDGAACAITTACKATGLPEDSFPFSEELRAHLQDAGLMPTEEVYHAILRRNELESPHAEIADWLESIGL